MRGLVQDRLLAITHLLVRAHRRLGGVLNRLGVSVDGRVATFAWNASSRNPTRRPGTSSAHRRADRRGRHAQKSCPGTATPSACAGTGTVRRGGELQRRIVGVPRAKSKERPLACVVVAPGEELSKDDVLDFLRGKVADYELAD